MVHIRITGRPDQIQAAVARIDRIMYVTTAGDITRPIGRGATYRDVTAELEPIECDHRTAVVVRRGQPEHIGATYVIEYGVCSDCAARVVRVRVETGGELRSVGFWSALTEVETPQPCTGI